MLVLILLVCAFTAPILLGAIGLARQLCTAPVVTVQRRRTCQIGPPRGHAGRHRLRVPSAVAAPLLAIGLLQIIRASSTPTTPPSDSASPCSSDPDIEALARALWGEPAPITVPGAPRISVPPFGRDDFPAAEWAAGAFARPTQPLAPVAPHLKLVGGADAAAPPPDAVTGSQAGTP